MLCLTGFQKTDTIVKELALLISAARREMQEHQQENSPAKSQDKEQTQSAKLEAQQRSRSINPFDVDFAIFWRRQLQEQDHFAAGRLI